MKNNKISNPNLQMNIYIKLQFQFLFQTFLQKLYSKNKKRFIILYVFNINYIFTNTTNNNWNNKFK